MDTWRMVRGVMEDFAQRIEEPFGLSAGKVPTQERTASLIIGIGGAGCDALLETKGRIDHACCLAKNEKDKPPRNVAYLCLDTDVASRDARSSAETGRVRLEMQEFVHLYGHGMAGAPAEAQPPYIKEWLDADRFPVHDMGVNGSGGIRQNGRLLLFWNVDRVCNMLRRAIHGTTVDRWPERLNIYVLAGVGGGTGSGAFLDVAYLARKAAEEVVGACPVTVFGYLFTPDVHIRRVAGEENRSRLHSNGYAALRELDRVLALHGEGGMFEQHYGTEYVATSRPPFDFVHIVGGCGEAGVPADPYGDAMRTVAQSILPFVVQERPSSIGPLAMVAHYHAIKTGAAVPAAAGTYANYLAPGTAEYVLPTGKFLRVAFSKVLNKIGGLFQRRPTQPEVEQACFMLELKPEQLLRRLTCRTPDFLPENCRWADIFGGNPRFGVREQYGRWMDHAVREVHENGRRFLDAFPGQFRHLSENWFTDPACGPGWLAALLTPDGKEDSLPDMLEKIEKETEARIVHQRGRMEFLRRRTEELGHAAAAAMILTRERKTQEFIAALYDYAAAFVDTEILGRMRDIYRFGIDCLRAEGENCYNPVADMLSLLWDICEHDGEALENVGASAFFMGQYTGRPFTVTDVRYMIGREVDAAGTELQAAADFFRVLHKHTEKWAGEQMGPRQIRGMDVRSFVRDYLEAKFGGLAACTLREAVNIHMSAGDATAAIRHCLAPDLAWRAEQQIRRTAAADDASACWMFTVPDSAPAAAAAMHAFGAADLPKPVTVSVQLSVLDDCILAQGVRCGLSLSDLNCMPLCERHFRMAAGAGHTAGLFLRPAWKETVCAEL